MNVRHVPVQSFPRPGGEIRPSTEQTNARPNISHVPSHYWDTSFLIQGTNALRESIERLGSPIESEKSLFKMKAKEMKERSLLTKNNLSFEELYSLSALLSNISREVDETNVTSVVKSANDSDLLATLRLDNTHKDLLKTPTTTISEEHYQKMKKQRFEERTALEDAKQERRSEKKRTLPQSVPTFHLITAQKVVPAGKRQPERSPLFDATEPPMGQKVKAVQKKPTPQPAKTEPQTPTKPQTPVKASKSSSKKNTKSPKVEKVADATPRLRPLVRPTQVLVYDAKRERENDIFFEEITEVSRKRQKKGPPQGFLSTPSLHDLWMKIAREDIPKAFLQRRDNRRAGFGLCKKQARQMSDEILQRAEAIAEAEKSASSRSKKIFKKVSDHLRKTESKASEQRKKKMDAEREKKRQEKKLNYLITRTELYSHFMSNRVNKEEAPPVPILPNDAEFTAEDTEAVFGEVESAIKKQESRTNEFDSKVSQHRQDDDEDEEEEEEEREEDDEGFDENGLITEPRMFNGKLKEYQKKGITWLVNLYNQGINGILADEMGLGKTVQTIAFMGHLAEKKGIWGPFMVVAPKSTLPNWCREIKQFTSDRLRVLPYWGSVKQRKVLRKSMTESMLHTKHATFHVLVTSYQMVVSDKSFFSKIKWEYMILDEAQAIKSANSQRWTTLLGLKDCRNRLLLTGTPIQNNMAELWALLHFIMPTLFDDHQEFAEWFSKDIESHAENKASGLNQTQLQRLYMVLKPFMLRREKKDVLTEMPPKTEIKVRCHMTPRQIHLYTGLKKNLTIADLLDQAKNSKNVKHLMNLVMQFRKVCNHPNLFESPEATSPFQFTGLDWSYEASKDDYSLVVTARNPISFTLPRLVYTEGMFPNCLNLSLCTGVVYSLHEKWLQNRLSIFNQEYIATSLKPEVRAQSGDASKNELLEPSSNCWSFLRFVDMSPRQVEEIWSLDNAVARWAYHVAYVRPRDSHFYYLNSQLEDSPCEVLSNLASYGRFLIDSSQSALSLPSLRCSTYLPDIIISDPEERLHNSHILISTCRVTQEAVLATPPRYICNSRSFVYQQYELMFNRYMRANLIGPWVETAMSTNPDLYLEPGLEDVYYDPRHLFNLSDLQIVSSLGVKGSGPGLPSANPISEALRRSAIQVLSSGFTPRVPPPVLSRGLLSQSLRTFGSEIRVPDFNGLVRDSGKMKVLARLLSKLKREKHRVLIYSQMTLMLDILQDFLSAKSFKFVRLDGSFKLEDRQEMVDLFQTDGSIFAFLLSTRAGGLGINLTSADTVIFYDSDWNPTIDAQAMDRAHRLGQRRPVTVYRLITSKTVEERILERAQQKHKIQSMVISGNYEAAQDEQIWGASEFADILMEDEVESTQKKKRQMSGFVVPRKRENKLKSPKKSAEGQQAFEQATQPQLNLTPEQMQQQQQLILQLQQQQLQLQAQHLQQIQHQQLQHQQFPSQQFPSQQFPSQQFPSQQFPQQQFPSQQFPSQQFPPQQFPPQQFPPQQVSYMPLQQLVPESGELQPELEQSNEDGQEQVTPMDI
eukprot:TRINITY_DN1537_c0_g1_i2.p1 TRINITY_DN1537_c0_g1~~TRINITY_DN1537_c0_g1_i2.p1  ORF type:complete len:1547 (-),score=321.48 TRINITY_DN1537_c0_g1_i2:24-4637(-)